MFSNLALIYECKAVFCAVTTKKGILKRGGGWHGCTSWCDVMCFRPFCRIFNFPNHYFAAPLTIFALDPPFMWWLVVMFPSIRAMALFSFNLMGKIRIDPDLALVWYLAAWYAVGPENLKGWFVLRNSSFKCKHAKLNFFVLTWPPHAWCDQCKGYIRCAMSIVRPILLYRCSFWWNPMMAPQEITRNAPGCSFKMPPPSSYCARWGGQMINQVNISWCYSQID